MTTAFPSSRRNPPILLAAVFTVLLLTPLLAAAGYAEAPPQLSPGLLLQPLQVEFSNEATVGEMYRALGTAAGVDVALAPLFKDFRIEWSPKSQNLGEALEELGRVASTFWVASDSSSILVSNDTPQMRRLYEPIVVASFPLRFVSIGDMMTALRTIYGVKHISADEARNLLTVRDSASTIRLARDLVERHDVRPSKTLVTLELVAGDETLLSSDVSIVGQGEAGVEVRRSPLHQDTWLDLSVSLDARTEGGEVVLDLGIESALIRRNDEDSHSATRGTWRSEDSEPFLVRLPLQLGAEGGRKSLALRVTPKVVDKGESLAAKDLWVGTEAAFRVPDTAP